MERGPIMIRTNHLIAMESKPKAHSGNLAQLPVALPSMWQLERMSERKTVAVIFQM